ncbi:T9SS type A sorting domain-containing protein [bacterium]|nr:T9SS type A sorting domain-containing protein [bacterium]
MKQFFRILALGLATSLGLSATVHQVSNQGQTFAPQTVIVQAGDTVNWVLAGTHNVNGQTSVYPANPVGFFSGAASLNQTFSFQFTVAGTYTYQCDPHVGNGMIGTVIVRPSLSNSLAAGDIMVTGYNADGLDGFAFVALEDIPAYTTIWFTDEEWTGSGFGTGEGDGYWYNTVTTPKGTVVDLSGFQSSPFAMIATTGFAGRGTKGAPNFGASDEQFYIYTGRERAVQTFLTAFSNESFTFGGATLAGTGLTDGVNAFNISGDEDVAEYTGTRTGQTKAQYQVLLTNATNWISQDASGNQDADGTAPDAPFSTTSFSINAGGPGLQPVTGLSVVANGTDEVQVSWTKPIGTNGTDWDGVVVYISENPFSGPFFTNNTPEAANFTGNFSFGGGTPVNANGTPNTGFTIYRSNADANGNISIDGLTDNTTYYVRAYAYTVEAGNDNFSAEADANGTTDSNTPLGSDLMIVGSVDGPLTGGVPKVIELYAINAVADLSEYSLKLYANGSATPTTTILTNLGNGSLNAGDRFYVESTTTGFFNYFGFNPDTTGSVFLNGDDAVALERNGVTVDVLGQLGQDGTGQCWDYVDGWIYRNNGSSPTATFNCADWTYSGIDALDGTTTNASASNPYPIGTYGIVATVDLQITEVMAGSVHSNSNINGDWFEITNVGASAVNLAGFSWDDDSKLVGTYVFPNITLLAGQSLIVLDEDSVNVQAWTNIWSQTSNGIKVVARDQMTPSGFAGLSQSGDRIYLWDASNVIVDTIAYTSYTAGSSLVFANGVNQGQSVSGVNGAYTSLGNDIGSPANLAPVAIVIPDYTIADINDVNNMTGVADSAGVYCAITGVVTSCDFDGNAGYSFFITDGTGWLNVFNFVDVNGYQSNIGDSVRFVGTLTQFNGLLEIVPDSLVVLATNATVPAPAVVMHLDESTESQYIRLNGVSVIDTTTWPSVGQSANVAILSGMDTLTLRIDSDTDIDGSPVPTGTFDLIGHGSQFDASNPFTKGYQILPCSLLDIVQDTCPTGYNVMVNFVNKYDYSVAFSAIPGATAYTVEYRLVGDPSWTTRNTGASPKTVTVLGPGTWEFRVGALINSVYEYSCPVEVLVDCFPVNAGIVVFKAPFCATSPATYRVNFSGGVGAKTFLWSTGATTRSITVAPGTYNCIVTDAYGCSDTASITSSAPAGSFESTTLVSVVKSGANFTVNWNPKSIPGATVIGYRAGYRLQNSGLPFNNSPLLGGTSHVFDLSSECNGNYEFTVTVRYQYTGSPAATSAPACSISRGHNFGPCKGEEGMAADDAANSLSVYPNPTSGDVFVALNGEETMVEVLDLNGRVVMSNVFNGVEAQLNIAELANGMYILRATAGNEVAIAKIVKE